MSKLELVIVLAAGDGTRMKSNKAKVLHEIAGQTIIESVLAAVAPLSAKNLTVVVGADKDVVVEHISKISTKIQTVEQVKRNGTGAAAQLALDEHKGDGTVLILAGDTPLLTTQTLQEFLDAHSDQGHDASVLTALLPDPTGYGRVISNAEVIPSPIKIPRPVIICRQSERLEWGDASISDTCNSKIIAAGICKPVR